MLRRLRGVLGTALTWGAGWTVIGSVIGGAQVLALRTAGSPIPMTLSRFIVLVTLRWAVFGAISGALFALVLWYAGRRVASLSVLSTIRSAGWSALAGAVVPLTGGGDTPVLPRPVA